MSIQIDREAVSETRLLELIREIYSHWDMNLLPLAVRLPDKPVHLSAVAHLIEGPLREEIDAKDATIRILVEMLCAKKPDPLPVSDPAMDRRRAYDRARKSILPADWPRRRQAVFERDGFKCVYCGASECRLHCDHVIALSCGGSHELDNLVTACGPCNIKKNNRPAEEFLGGSS